MTNGRQSRSRSASREMIPSPLDKIQVARVVRGWRLDHVPTRVSLRPFRIEIDSNILFPSFTSPTQWHPSGSSTRYSRNNGTG